MCETHLNVLLLAVMQAPPDSLERKKALHRLIVVLQQLPGIAKSSHPNYMIALTDTWQWVCRNIDDFDVSKSIIQGVTLEKALVNWINGYLKHRIKDLYIDKLDMDKLEKKTNVLRFDAYTKDDFGNFYNKKLNSKLSDPILNGLDAEIEKERQLYYRQIADKIRTYIETDPNKILQNSHIRNNPNCNCKYLSERLLLQETPDSLKVISQELNVNYQTLVTRWSRCCLPLLREICEQMGYQLIEKL